MLMDIIIQVNYSDTLTGFVLKQYKRADVEYYHDCVVIILSLINYVYLYSRLYLATGGAEKAQHQCDQ